MSIIIKYIFCFFVVNTIYSSSYSQNQCATIGTQWYYCRPYLPLSNPFYDFELFKVVKDTILQGKNCRLIKSDSSTEIQYREDGKVYYWFLNKFNLIYNDSAKVGDTIFFDIKTLSPHRRNYYYDTTIKVKTVLSKIETKSIGTYSFRYFTYSVLKDTLFKHVSWYSNYQYIENIGFEDKFYFTLDLPSIPVDLKLRCYLQGELKYKSEWYSQFKDIDCNYAWKNSINDNLSNQQVKLSYFDSKNVLLEFEKPQNCLSINVYNLNGSLIKNMEIDKQFQSAINIPFKDIPTGLYFIIIHSESIHLTHKIIIK